MTRLIWADETKPKQKKFLWFSFARHSYSANVKWTKERIYIKGYIWTPLVWVSKRGPISSGECASIIYAEGFELVDKLK